MTEEEQQADEENKPQEPSTKLESPDILQLQLSEYQQLQSMARGILGFVLAIVAIIITALSAFYTPLPTPPSEPSAYQAAQNSVPLDVHLSVAVFTVTLSFLQSIVFLMMTTICLVFTVNNILEILLPRNQFMNILYTDVEIEDIDSLVRDNRAHLQDIRERYLRGGLRLILAIIVGSNAFLIYNLSESLEIWTLLWLQTAYLLPSAILSKGFTRLFRSSGSDDSDSPLLVEALIDEGERWGYFQLRSYENLLWGIVSGIALLVVLSWILSLIFIQLLSY